MLLTDVARQLKANTSRPLLRTCFTGGGYGATGIMEIYDDSSKDTAGDEEGIH